MSAYLTSGIGQLAATPFALSASLTAEQLGALSDGPSRFIDTDVDLDEIEGMVVSQFGADGAHRLSRDVLAFGEKPVQVIQKLPSEEEGAVLDFTRLVSPSVSSKPVVMFRPGFKSRDLSFSGWMEALKCLGHDIRVVRDYAELGNALHEFKPDIICLSALEYQLPHLAEAWRTLTNLTPRAITILGGYAALPSAANFFDVVVPGEGDIVLPILLRFFQRSIARKTLGRERSRPEAARPWQLGAGTVMRLFNLSARRVCSTPEDAVRSVPVDIGSNLHIGQAVEGDQLGAMLKQSKGTWHIPINSTELETLWKLPPEEPNRSNHACLYVQRGCKPDPKDRCNICTITSPSGRRMSPEKVVETLKELHRRGYKAIAFGDDNFIQDRRWIDEFLEECERAGFGKDFRIYFQTRADVWTSEIVTRMWDLGMRIETGLETMNPVRAERMGKVRKGRGGPYVKKGKRLMKLAAKYASEKGMDTSDLLRVYMIAAGYGDTLEDIVFDVEEQLKFVEELRKEGLKPPVFSFNLRQHIHTRDPITEKLIDPAKLEETRINYDREKADNNGTTSVDLGEITAIFYPFFFRPTGDVEGMMHPLSYRSDELVSSFLLFMRSNVYGDDDPSRIPKPTSKSVHGAAISALEDMIGVLESHYESREKAEDLVGRLTRSFRAAYAAATDAA